MSTKIMSAAPFRVQSSANPFLSPQVALGAESSFLEGALTKAGLLSAKR
jgi:hypothetical protein